jgi:hypothetical protein
VTLTNAKLTSKNSPLAGFDKLLSFADGFELEMEENKPLLSSVEQPEAKKRIYGSDTRVSSRDLLGPVSRALLLLML